jgi:ubiquitin C-terminal hydrolase
MDLSVEIQKINSSLPSYLNEFVSVVKLIGENKYWCDKCYHLQEVEKRLRIKSPPQVLIYQLKRFKYTQEGELQGLKKLFHRVAFPIEFRLHVNSRGDEGVDDPLYSLFVVLVHVGCMVNYGHYIVVVKSIT